MIAKGSEFAHLNVPGKITFSKEEGRKIKIIDLIARGPEYAHSNVPGKITFSKEEEEENKND